MDFAALQELRTRLLEEVRSAQEGLSIRSLAALSRYSNALYELDRVERLMNRYAVERHHSPES